MRSSKLSQEAKARILAAAEARLKLTDAAIATREGVTLRTVKSWLARARKKLASLSAPNTNTDLTERKDLHTG